MCWRTLCALCVFVCLCVPLAANKQTHLCAQVSACHHDAVCSVDNRIKVLQAIVGLQLGYQLNLVWALCFVCGSVVVWDVVSVDSAGRQTARHGRI